MKILLTGGAGFMGSHLVERLIARGHDVRGIDVCNGFYDPRIKRSNLPQGGFRLHEGDIRNAASVVDREKPDLLIHLAARAGVRPSQKDPALYESVNVAGTLGLLEACRTTGVKRVVFASSSSVYGHSPLPFRQEGPDLRPLSFF